MNMATGEIFGFTDLKVGQRVKIKGKIDDTGIFTAFEISVKNHKENPSIVGLIKEIDYKNRTMNVLNHSLKISENIEVVDTIHSDLEFNHLKKDTMVKIRVNYTPPNHLEPVLIKIRETFGFNIDKLKGEIDAIDTENKCLRVLGFEIRLNPKTVVELPDLIS